LVRNEIRPTSENSISRLAIACKADCSQFVPRTNPGIPEDGAGTAAFATGVDPEVVGLGLWPPHQNAPAHTQMRTMMMMIAITHQKHPHPPNFPRPGFSGPVLSVI